MVTVRSSYKRFLMSTETELLTALCGQASIDPGQSIVDLLEECSRLAPSAPGQLGLFNGYGRIYWDIRHLELAAAECDSPYALISIIERQQALLANALARLQQRGVEIGVSNCNHSGLLSDSAATWGSHENYLIHQRPEELADDILPFLVSRLYTGAGGVHWPTGNFLAGVRLQFLNRDRGGGTMNDRAIHSTARAEDLTSDPARYGHRYHILLGDSLQSQFSQFLRFGSTAVVLKMLAWEASMSTDVADSIDATKQLGELERMPTDGHGGRSAFWMRALRRFNVLAEPGAALLFHPMLCQVQRLYLDRCDRFADAHPDLPAWVREVLAVWDSTLNALERGDDDWLAERLDPWIKHRLITRFLDETGLTWHDVPQNRELHERLALLNQDYHDFSRSDSVFSQLERHGMLRQRVTPAIEPGTEPDPFVPETSTRAAARARFLKQHTPDGGLMNSSRFEIDWTTIIHNRTRRIWRLDDPFALECCEILPSH